MKVQQTKKIDKISSNKLWLMKRKQYFWIWYLKIFHVKYVKSNNKICPIFNQDEDELTK
jgi:hypothetical protein